MSQTPPAGFSKPATLGAVLLTLSATLFAADVGGTYVLDAGLDKTNTAIAPGSSSSNVAAAAAPAAAAPAAVAPAAVTPAQPPAAAVAAPVQHTAPKPAIEHRRLAAVVAVAQAVKQVPKVAPAQPKQQPKPAEPVVVAMAPPIDQTVSVQKPLSKPAIVMHWPAIEQHPTIVVHQQAVAKPQRPTVVAAVVRHQATPVVMAAIAQHPAPVIAAVVEHPAVAVVAPAPPVAHVVSAPVHTVALVPAHAAPVAVAVGGSSVASLRDVRHYIMKKVSKKYAGMSVISASTYTDGKSVVVDLVMRDKNHVWFQKDYVHRNGSKIAVVAEKQRTMPHVESRGAPLVLTADTQ